MTSCRDYSVDKVTVKCIELLISEDAYMYVDQCNLVFSLPFIFFPETESRGSNGGGSLTVGCL